MADHLNKIEPSEFQRQIDRVGARWLRDDLTPQQLFNLEEYGSIHFESAGATRK